MCHKIVAGNIRPDGIQAVNIQSLLREKIAFLSGEFSQVSYCFARMWGLGLEAVVFHVTLY